MAHILAIVGAIVFSILFELFASSYNCKNNCKKEINYKNNIKICVTKEEKIANAFVNTYSLRNNDTIIFVTEKLFKEFENKNISNEEFAAIIEHEINHLKKKHFLFILPINFAILFIFILFVIEIFFVILKSILTNRYSVLEFVLLLILFASNYLVNYSVNIFSKRLEFEADNVEKNCRKQLAEALKKLARINNTSLHFEGKTHPSVERRIQRLLEER